MKYKVTNTSGVYVVLNDSNRTGLAPNETKTVEGKDIDFLGLKVEGVKISTKVDKKLKEVDE